MRRKKKRESQEDAAASEASGPPVLAPIDVQQKEFRLAFRGYNERDVDAFLDEVTEELSALIEENKRLREGSGAPAAPIFGGDADAATREAEEIVARAREEAAAMLREAEARGAVSSASAAGYDVRAISGFLTTEKDFLQSLAGLIQGHAETVKGMARAAREGAAAAAVPLEPAGFAPEPVAPEAVEPEPVEVSEPEPALVPEPEPEPAPEPEPWIVEPATPAPTTIEEADPVDVDEVTIVESSTAGRGDEGDRSLRDLFWGED